MLIEEVYEVPKELYPSGASIKSIPRTEHGKFALVGIEASPIEQNHIVIVIDEYGQPMTGIRVVFAFGSGQQYNIPIRRNFWMYPEPPRVIRGNVQKTLLGKAQHTVGQGGETIFIYHTEANGNLELSSDMVEGCGWFSDTNHNMHTCMMLTFQRQRMDVNPFDNTQLRLSELEDRIIALENKFEDFGYG